jgi:cytidine deaminase
MPLIMNTRVACLKAVAIFCFAFIASSKSAYAAPGCEALFGTPSTRAISSAPSAQQILEVLQKYIRPTQIIVKPGTVRAIRRELDLPYEQVRYQLAVLAAARRSTPISNFPVGAAGFTSDGTAILGANIEFRGAALNFSIHAERSVLLMANEAGQRIVELYSTVTPCGGCRQWLNEIDGAENLKIVSRERNGQYFGVTLKELLPKAFGPLAMGQKGLLHPKQYRRDRSQWVTPTTEVFAGPDEDLSPRELEALVSGVEKSYSPYGGPSAAVLMRLKFGSFLMGTYTETAAHESIPAFAVAYAKLKLSGRSEADVSHIYLMRAQARPPTGPFAPPPPADGLVSPVVDHLAVTKLLLDSTFAPGTVRFHNLFLANR